MRDRIAENRLAACRVTQRAVEGQAGVKFHPREHRQCHRGAPGRQADFYAARPQALQSLQRFLGDALGLHIDQRAVNIKKCDFRLHPGILLCFRIHPV